MGGKRSGGTRLRGHEVGTGYGGHVLVVALDEPVVRQRALLYWHSQFGTGLFSDEVRDRALLRN